MLPYQFAWKTYFWFSLVLTVLSVGMEIREGIQIDTVAGLVWEVFSSVVTIIGFVGLFGYVWQVPISKPSLWKVIFALNLVLIVGGMGYGLATEPEVEKSSIAATFIIVSILAAFILPYIVASFRYGFRCYHLWGAP